MVLQDPGLDDGQPVSTSPTRLSGVFVIRDPLDKTIFKKLFKCNPVSCITLPASLMKTEKSKQPLSAPIFHYVIIYLRRLRLVLLTSEVCGQMWPSVPDVFLSVGNFKVFVLFMFYQTAFYLISMRLVCFTDCKTFLEYSFF